MRRFLRRTPPRNCRRQDGAASATTLHIRGVKKTTRLGCLCRPQDGEGSPADGASRLHRRERVVFCFSGAGTAFARGLH
ncbi:MAG: hypothetical protein MPJ22_00515 [Pirellulales bacterium]|nr:hypothetical protein [Pirellulales bacterium]